VVVHAQRVEAQLREMRGDLLGVRVLREVPAEAGVHAPESDSTCIREEMRTADPHEAVRARGLQRKRGQIRDGRRGVVAGNHEINPLVGGLNAAEAKRRARQCATDESNRGRDHDRARLPEQCGNEIETTAQILAFPNPGLPACAA
jgi:hypothetical protein